MRLKFHGDSDDIRLVGRDDYELMDVSGWGADSFDVPDDVLVEEIEVL